MAEFPLNNSVVQVLNGSVGLVRLFFETSLSGRARTARGKWACGTPVSPVKSAEFGSSSSTWDGRHRAFGFCELCYGDSCPLDRVLESAMKKHFDEMAKQHEEDQWKDNQHDIHLAKERSKADQEERRRMEKKEEEAPSLGRGRAFAQDVRRDRERRAAAPQQAHGSQKEG